MHEIYDEIWLKTCDASNSNSNKAGKYWFNHDESTGLIMSEGSRDYDASNSLCFKLNSATRFYKQRVKLAKCNSQDVLQQFDYLDGKIYPRSEHRLCAGYEFDKFEAAGQTAMIFSTCYPGAFAVNLDSVK